MQRSSQGIQVAAWVAGWAVLALFGLPACVREAAEPRRPQVYTAWPFDATEARRRQEETARALGVKAEQNIDLGHGVKMTFVLVPAGEFMMGSPQGEQDRDNDEGLHRVTIGQPFWMGKHEVTQEQWEAVMGNNPSRFKGAKNPVEGVSWNEIQGFLEKFDGGRAGGGLALPTEAQWEYACRAGTGTRFCSGDDIAGLGAYAWHRDNSQGTTHAVGQKRANAWGLHDMHGNVWEWCSSPYSEKYDGREQKGAEAWEAQGDLAVLRGGSWDNNPRYCRSATRNGTLREFWYALFGFRVCRSARTSE